eukprot:2477980-Prymnesium_polylepis.1
MLRLLHAAYGHGHRDHLGHGQCSGARPKARAVGQSTVQAARLGRGSAVRRVGRHAEIPGRDRRQAPCQAGAKG